MRKDASVAGSLNTSLTTIISSAAPHAVVWTQLLDGKRDGGSGGLPQRTLLLGAQNPSGQPLPPCIGEQADHPGPEVIGNKGTPLSCQLPPVSVPAVKAVATIFPRANTVTISPSADLA
jgi:hypothetical protein